MEMIKFMTLRAVKRAVIKRAPIKRAQTEVTAAENASHRQSFFQWVLCLFMLATMVGEMSYAIASPSTNSIKVTDIRGKQIVLPAPAVRVVSLAPHITELVFAVGGGKQLVGVVNHSDYPEAAKAIPQVGRYDKINIESIVTLKPDLVIVWQSGNGDNIASRLESLGLTTFVVEPRKLEDIATTLKVVGKLLGHTEQGNCEANTFLQRLRTLRQQYSHKTPVSIFYQVWHEPLMTLNGEHLISDVLALCGGNNVFADAIPLVPRLSVESVIRANPQVVLASGMGEARPEWLDMWRRWPSLQAQQHQQLYFVPPDILQRHTPRVLQGTARVCDALEQARAVYYPQQQIKSMHSNKQDNKQNIKQKNHTPDVTEIQP